MSVEVILGENLKVDVNYRGTIIKTDQPTMAGGDGSAPSPMDLFFASIAACAGYYAKAFCLGRGISYEGIKITMDMSRSLETRLVDNVVINVELPSGFPEKYTPALIKSVESCAVKKHINAGMNFQVNSSNL
ncbi:MAG: OsmC family protein [Bacteroidetes bacterium]|nr:OsmC family protein [Bacteroidota bacterium]